MVNELWNGRCQVRLSNEVVEAGVLPGGGHIAEFRFASGSGLSKENAIWRPPWTTADPNSAQRATLAAQYGDLGIGSFLASYTGHALCLDGFGPPGKEEAQAGVGLHGEAANTCWQFANNDSRSSAFGTVNLPIAGLRVERSFRLFAGESLLRVHERVHNLRNIPRELHWVQHATLGPPCFPSGCLVTASATNGMTWPCGYEGHALLPDDAFFRWPQTNTVAGDSIDLRRLFEAPGYGFVAATQLNPERAFSFIAALNPQRGLAFGYCFRTVLFPWLTLWEENLTRAYPPWNGRVQARGMEFGTTPFPLGKDEIAKRGPLFDAQTMRQVASNGSLRASWLMFLAAVPRNWQAIEDVRTEDDHIVLVEGAESVAISARGVRRFLEAPDEDTMDATLTEKPQTL